ncbi:MAG TPA: hypothetical protein VH142_13615 [Polyangiaceae bacterium]|nr:hypothetical protein [Polyangiaceae bacterium]
MPHRPRQKGTLPRAGTTTDLIFWGGALTERFHALASGFVAIQIP